MSNGDVPPGFRGWEERSDRNESAGLESRLWASADQLRANTGLTGQEYSTPVLGLIFLRFADHRFTEAEKEFAKDVGRRREPDRIDFQSKGVMYLPEEARYSHLLALPESENTGMAVNRAMRAIESENEDLSGVLPRNYTSFENGILVALLKNFSEIPMDIEGDVFGRIYEYFLSRFALSEGQRGGEFFTPTSLVKLIVEIIEPYRGRILDPACGSGGMFVQSARFIENHERDPGEDIAVFGQEKTGATVKLCRMNLAVHSLAGDIREANSYYEDPHDSTGRFDFVMANPPFNVDGVNRERIKDDPRYPLGIPKADNANYLWMQHFYSALNERGRAGFVMSSAAGTAGHSEQGIRERLLKEKAVDVIVSVGTNFFYSVALPCTLWFYDRGKRETGREDKVLFIDARHIFRQLDRTHRDFTPSQTEFVANIVRLYRGEDVERSQGCSEKLDEYFPSGSYDDVPGLCGVATLDEIEAEGWSLNPGRYVGFAGREPEDFVFAERLEELNEELETLNVEARELEERISRNVAKLLE